MNDKNIEQLGLDIQNQFTKIGEDLKNQLLKDFNDVLQKDLSDIKSVFESLLQSQNQKILNQSQQNLQNAIKQQLGGGALGNIFADSVLPTILNSTNNASFSSDNFNKSTSKNLLELGSAISKINLRNG